MKQVLLGGVAGGVALFLWGALSHMALRLGSVGLKEIPNETSVLSGLRSNIAEPGVYFFPCMNESAGMTASRTASRSRSSFRHSDFVIRVCLPGPSPCPLPASGARESDC